MQFLLCALVILAGISPLLIFARLWQVKEWRWDRLREHLRREGWFRQLFGIVRPIVVGIGVVTFFILGNIESTEEHASLALWGAISLLAWFTLFRIVIVRQAYPVCTKKAWAIVVLSLIVSLTLVLTLCFWWENPWVFVTMVVLPLVSFLSVVISMVLLMPLDKFLKLCTIRKARAIRKRLTNLAVVGITGSVGKTTTKELLAHILADRKVLATPAHVNTEMGVAALMIRELTDAYQIFIVEMGAYRTSEIASLCSIVRPHIGVITFIGRQHLGLFGSQEELVHAKGELFEALPAEGHAFLNADTEHAEMLMKRAACPVRTVGTGGHATYEAFDIVERTDGIAFTVRAVPFIVPILGTHQVTNVLLAVAAAEVLGVPLAESAKRLTTFKALGQTFERKVGASGQVVLDDTYNASPESFRAAIEWARANGREKSFLITSGLQELGEEEWKIYQELGVLSRDVFDEVIFLNKKCVRYFELGFGKPVRVFPKKKFSLKIEKNMLIVCVGRMQETIVEKLLQ